MLMYVNLYSTNPDHDEKFLYNFADINLLAELQAHPRRRRRARSSAPASTRCACWLKPDQMRAYNVSTEEVMEAIARAERRSAAPGDRRDSDRRQRSRSSTCSRYQGKFNTPEQYESILIRANADGELLRAQGRREVELGSEFFDIYSQLRRPALRRDRAASRPPAATRARSSRQVKDELERAQEGQRSRRAWTTRSATTSPASSTRRSRRCVNTLVEAFLLVALVVFVFLGTGARR